MITHFSDHDFISIILMIGRTQEDLRNKLKKLRLFGCFVFGYKIFCSRFRSIQVLSSTSFELFNVNTYTR